ncbi:unnamed protein product [Rhizophagus irregularis]|nr:unnamed protein product [Rhizophagus irregularis]
MISGCVSRSGSAPEGACIKVSKKEVTEGGGTIVVLAGVEGVTVGAGSSVSIASSAVLAHLVVAGGGE